VSGCIQCGQCCLKYGWRLEASTTDIARWAFDDRKDILSRVLIKYDEKSEVSGGDLWVDDQGRRVDRCPFLAEKDGRHYCTIQDVKPEVCSAHYCERYMLQ
jgi:Fe-S-cluster containining protein